MIEKRDGSYHVRDLCSTLGTIVNGEPIGDHFRGDDAPLRAGENVMIAGGVDSPFVLAVLSMRQLMRGTELPSRDVRFHGEYWRVSEPPSDIGHPTLIGLFCTFGTNDGSASMKEGRPECVVEAVPEDPSRPGGATDLYLIFDGKRIAKRGKPGTLHAMTWIPLEPGVVVRDVPMPESESGWGMVVEINSVRVH
jgi:FHA domain